MYDIITFGSGTNDTYLLSDNFLVAKNRKLPTKKGICFGLGSKTDIKDILITTGGGGTNTAHAFNKQGFKTAWCGMVGNDFNGKKIIDEFKEDGICADFIFQTDKKSTSFSVIIISVDKERTILAYRGASAEITKNDIPWQDLQTQWIYTAPLSGNSAYLWEDLVNYAKDNNIKIASNPGKLQLSLPKHQIENILKKIDVIFLNQEEASFLTKVNFKKEKEIFKKLDEMIPGICIMTKGKEGAIASDGKNLYVVSGIKEEIIDATGAGDAFASGFLSEFIRTNDIVSSMQLGIANGSACLLKWGAKNGLLTKDSQYEKVKVSKM